MSMLTWHLLLHMPKIHLCHILDKLSLTQHRHIQEDTQGNSTCNNTVTVMKTKFTGIYEELWHFVVMICNQVSLVLFLTL